MWEVFVPTAIDKISNVVAHNEFIGEAGFGAGVDDDGGFVDEVVALDRRV